MFAPQKKRKIEDNKSVNPFNLTSEQQKQLDELRLTNEKLNKEKNELEEKLKQIKAQKSVIKNKLGEFAQKPDMELEGLLKEKMPEFKARGISCHADLVRQVIAIDLYPVENLEAVKKVFHSFVDPKYMKISDEPFDGTFRIGGPFAFLEIDMKERGNLLKGLQLAQAELDIPMSRSIMKC